MASRIVKLEEGQDSSGSSNEELEPSDEEEILHEAYDTLEESIYGWAVSMVVRDTVFLSEGTAVPWHRLARILNSMFLIVATIVLQIFLLLAVSRLLSAPAVLTIRKTYDKYQVLMYPNHTEFTVNGFHRGLPGYRQEERFHIMSEDEAKEVCEIPMAHPYYLASILFIWTLTCQLEVRAIYEEFVRVIWKTPTIRNASDVLKPGEEDHSVYVMGLTRLMKFIIGGLVLLPRMITLVALLYIGCRWLTATLGLGDVLLNGLALEFLVLLKELFYNVCVSHRNRVDTQRLLVRPFRDINKATCCTFFDTQMWGLLSLIWVVSYIYYVQMVLPDYRWDVYDLCNKFLPKGPLF